MAGYLNIDSWERKELFRYYRDFDDPLFQITALVEIDDLLKHSREKGYPFFLTSLYVGTRAAARIENFRYRWDGDQVLCYDDIFPGSTVFYDDRSFGFCYFNFFEDLKEFVVQGTQKMIRQKEERPFETQSEDKNVIYFSVLPWIHFTGIKHASDHRQDTSIPRIVYGKYQTVNEKQMMPVSVEVNHALMDGYHVGMFFKYLEETIEMVTNT